MELSAKQKDALKQAFDDIDVDGTGSISKSELRTALQLIGQNPTAEEMTAYTEGLGAGDFSLEEFYSYIEHHIPIKTRDQLDKELMEAFEKFDEDQDFYITREDFRKVMTKLGDEPLTEHDGDNLLADLGAMVTDGKLSVAELARLLME